MRLSVVVPAFNEADSLAELHGELARMVKEHGGDAEFLFVDDGSTDDTWAGVEALAARDPRVRGIRLRRNFGKAAALQAGFTRASGDVLVTMDADLQDDPAEIPRLLAELERGADVVSGWKQVRHDPWHKVLPSRIFNRLVSGLTGVELHDHNCGLKAYRRAIFDEVRLYGELHRFVPVLAAARGWACSEVAVNHRPRRFGRSKYGVARLLKGLLDLFTVRFLTHFGRRPQHLLGTVGVAFMLLGVLGMTYLTGYWIVSQIAPWPGALPLSQRPALLYSVASMLFGGQMLSVGLLGEMIVANAGGATAPYSISCDTGGGLADEGERTAVPRRLAG